MTSNNFTYHLELNANQLSILRVGLMIMEGKGKVRRSYKKDWTLLRHNLAMLKAEMMLNYQR